MLVTHANDGLQSLVSNLGNPERDKAASGFYTANIFDDVTLYNVYQGSWIAEKLVDIPAHDAFRKWRTWQAETDQIKLIEKTEKRLGLQAKMVECKKRARIYGGAAIVIGTKDTDYSEPLEPDKVGRDGLTFLNVFSRCDLTAGQLVTDPLSDRYGLPEDYEVANSEQNSKIHSSRLVIQIGKPHPDPFRATGPTVGWGESVIPAAFDAIRNADSTSGNIASLIFEATVDVIRIPDLLSKLSDKKHEENILKRFQLAAAAKGINGTLILDALETYERKTTSFSALPDLMEKFLLIVSGAADIPMTRFLGQAPSGMDATGDGDMRNYYDKVSSMQELEVGPAMHNLDECIIWSALGSRPDEIGYEWTPLEQMSEKEIAEIGKTTAETGARLIETGLYDQEELREVVTNQLVENGVFPGLAQVVADGDAEFGNDPDIANDAAPRTLYAFRKVKNAQAIFNWAKEQGFKSVTTPDEMHVTIAWSKAPLDWLAIGETYNSEIQIAEGGARIIEVFGEGAVVLGFRCNELNWRHQEILSAGGRSSHPEYNAHITLTWNAGKIDPSQIEPYRGEIVLGPEVFEEIDPDWKSKIKES